MIHDFVMDIIYIHILIILQVGIYVILYFMTKFDVSALRQLNCNTAWITNKYMIPPISNLFPYIYIS